MCKARLSNRAMKYAYNVSLRFTFGFICRNSIGNQEIISDDEISDETPNFEISESDQDQDVDLLTEDDV